MQRTGLDRRKIIKEILFISLVVALILFDQITKTHFKNLRENCGWVIGSRIEVIRGFFYFRSVDLNTAAAYGFLGDVVWRQTFFISLTSVALIAFFIYYLYACRSGQKWLRVTLILIISGTIGNFIDRIAYAGVVDFLNITINGWSPFAVFNIADTLLCVGVVMLLLNFLFFDKNSLFGRKHGKNKDNIDGK